MRGVHSCGNEQGSDILHVRPGAAAGRQEEAGGGVDVQGMHAPGSGPVSSGAPVVGHCMLQTPPPLTVEASSQTGWVNWAGLRTGAEGDHVVQCVA